jgi:hypothetical protein
MSDLGQQTRYNRRKILVSFALFVPFFVGIMVAASNHVLPTVEFMIPICAGYFLFGYFAGNAILRWLARTWPE